MKTIGLIGGMSWESSAEYYRLINEEVKRRQGGLHSASCILYSVDFAEIETHQTAGNWREAGNILTEAAAALERAGASFIVICTNTMHKVADMIQESIQIPILHIADATVKHIQQTDVQTIGLLGTKYTMEQDFYKSHLKDNELGVLIPNEQERIQINKIIYEELCLGQIQQSSKAYFQQVIQDLVDNGAEGVILGCTEIGLLIQSSDIEVPLFDTTVIHATTAVHDALIVKKD
ncbi:MULTISPECIES: aspartate/glutamate racemase family protein [Gracilibacillus]|uniref:aspartate/glutamate racemase family protein n=1 Tax=Gracilibacillus TaxID=74385 RepID=UPI0008271D69|nr:MULTISPECIES: aspartate/glutamate racemase family protein [Gracilibacillus]